MPRKSTEPTAAQAPQSWALSRWSEFAPTVYPGTTEKARYMARAHKRELMEAGALVRVGRELVVIGAPYTRWLAKKAARVPDFQIAANGPQPAA